MTDKIKSPRKRRLQLNAEEFAPFSDSQKASNEPRLDETWVQYYGGEKQGGIKRLSSFDEEASLDEVSKDSTEISSQPVVTEDSVHNPVSPSLSPLSPAPQTTPHVHQHDETLPENRVQRALSPVRDIRRTEKPESGHPQKGHSIEAVEVTPSTPIQQIEDSKVINVSELSPDISHQSSQSITSATSFESWSKRWSPWLKRGGSIKVCEAFFQLTHNKGSAECFTSNSEIMRLTELSRAQCIRNIHYLIEMGILEELNEVNNREAKGTYYRFNLVPKLLTML